MFCAVEGEGHGAGTVDSLEFGCGQFAATGRGGFDRDDHKGWTIQDGS